MPRLSLSLALCAAAVAASSVPRSSKLSTRKATQYDRSCATFTPDGSILQVEYACRAGRALAARARHRRGRRRRARRRARGAAARRRDRDAGRRSRATCAGPDAPPQLERLHAIDDHVACVVAGVLPDALALVARARAAARAHRAAWGEPIPVALLAQQVCDVLQAATQEAGVRPFGASLLIAGWDAARGHQLYRALPTGTCARYRAAVIGGNARSSRRLERALLRRFRAETGDDDGEDDDEATPDDMLVDADGDAAPLLDATSQAARLLYELPQRVRARGPTPGSGAAAVRVEPLEMLLVSHRAGRTFVHFVDPEIALQLRTARKPAAGSAAAGVDPS